MTEKIEKQLELLNFSDTCSLLHISKGTLRKLEIPYLKIRRRILFRKNDIEQFIEENMRGGKNDSKYK